MRKFVVWRFAPLLLLMLVVSGAGQLSGAGGVTANALDASGAAAFDAPLVATWTAHGNVQGIDGTGWHLEAAHIDLFSETVDSTFYSQPMSLRTDQQPEVEERELRAVTSTVTALQSNSYIIVVGRDAAVTLAGADLHIDGTGGQAVKEPAKEDDLQAPQSASWDQALSASSQQATATIHGSFLVAVWGATLDVEHAEGTETWQTGRHNEQAVDPDGNIVVADDTWIYLDVTGGTLTIPAREIPAGTMIAGAQGGSLTVEGSLQARNAQGEVLGHALDGQDVLVSGSLQADGMTVQDGRLAFALKGDADSYVLDGRLVAVFPAKEGISWLWGLAAIPVLAAWLVRRQQPARRVARLRDALGRGRFSGVVRRAPRFFGTPWDKEARIATAVAYLRLDAPDRAMDVLEEGDVPRGMTCFLRAHALAVMGQLLEARALLREALESAPHLRYEAERNPALAPLLSVGSTEAYA